MDKDQSTAAGGVAVVTGGGSGIGAATSIKLAADGLAVAVWDRDLEAAQATVQEIESRGGKAIAVQVDVVDRDSVERAAATTREALGDITVLVNNAGVRDLIPFFDLTVADWDKVLDINLTGPFLCAKALTPRMKELGHGVIVNMGSITSLMSRPDRTAYVASKSGLLGLTHSLAEDLGPHGIRVNAIAPGFITTPLQATASAHAANQNLEERIPLRRKGTPEDIADVVSFLCSDASRYITGTIIPVDGGRAIVY